MHRAPTMRAVAALAGVSLKTVSRVVNREPGVSQELLDRVDDAIRLLDYRHNATASSLRRADRRTSTIGLLLDDVSNPFSSTLNRAIEDVARERETLVFAGSSDGDPEREAQFVRALAARQVDGLIVMPAALDHGTLLRERHGGLPMVFVDRLSTSTEVDSVIADNRGGVRQAIHHLARRGHERIGFLGDLSTIWTAEERYLGYVEGLAIEGLRLTPELVRRDVRGTQAAELAALHLLLLPDPPTALFASQNLLTFGAIRAIRSQSKHTRVALIGFDDFPLADMLSPPVTVVAQDPQTIGQTAARRLFARLDGDESPGQQISVPTQLIERGSGELSRGD
jgi:LacI family transcriptional regulator